MKFLGWSRIDGILFVLKFAIHEVLSSLSERFDESGERPANKEGRGLANPYKRLPCDLCLLFEGAPSKAPSHCCLVSKCYAPAACRLERAECRPCSA